MATMEDMQNKFINLMRDIKSESEKNDFLKWIYSNWNLDNLKEEDNADQSPKAVLTLIAEEIRPMVPFNSVISSENIYVPVCGPNADFNPKSTLYIDEFLYDDDYINDLVDKEEFSRYYCTRCLSKETKLLTLISHSMSVDRISFVFRCLLPPIKTGTLLDIGSRFGPVLYGAYMYTACENIIGVEMNSEFCQIQSKIVKKYKFDDRIKIICNNIFNELDVVSVADIIILNNVFEFFTDYNTIITSWHLLAQTIKPGCVLVTTPHLETTFLHFKVDFDWREWVEELKPHRLDLMTDEEDLNHCLENVKHYRVLKTFDEISKK